MKLIKIGRLIIVLSITSLCNGMEPESGGWLNEVKKSLLGSIDQFFLYIKSEPSEPFNFVGLPLEIQHHIISLLSQYSNATSLKEAGAAINALARTNKKLNLLVNEPQFCFNLIRFLAKKFKTSDEDAVRAIATKEVQRQFSLQKKLYSYVSDKQWQKHKNDIKNLCTAGVDVYSKADINFIYKSGRTLLMTAAKNMDISRFDFLVEQGADINFANNNGVTALMLAAEAGAINDMPLPFQHLIVTHKNFNINQQDSRGHTALLYAVSTIPIQKTIVKTLIDVGADPNIANFNGDTPLTLVKGMQKSQIIDQDINPIIDLFEQVIPKKSDK